MNATRPGALVFVAGTATEVGKTWWTAAVARELVVHGASVAARKPVQSGDPDAVSDAEVLAAATGEAPGTVCPPARTFPLAWAPPMAARELGLAPFTTADLAGGIEWPASVDVGLVEGVGGPRSPISDDGDNVDLAHLLAPDLVVLVALNRYADDELLHARNREHLTTVERLDVVTTPRELADRLRRP